MESFRQINSQRAKSHQQAFVDNLQKSLVGEFEIADNDINLEKALDLTHGGRLVPRHIINKQGKKQLVYILPEEITHSHEVLKAGDKFKTKNGEEHELVRDKGHDSKGGHLVTLKESKTGRIHDKYIHNLESVVSQPSDKKKNEIAWSDVGSNEKKSAPLNVEIGDNVSLKKDVNLISLMDLKGKNLKVVGFTKTGLISQPDFVEVQDENGVKHELNPDYLEKTVGSNEEKPVYINKYSFPATHRAKNSFTLMNEIGGTLTSGPTSRKPVTINKGDLISWELQRGSLGDLYNVYNHTTGEKAEFWEMGYSNPFSLSVTSLKDSDIKKSLQDAFKSIGVE